MAHADNKLKYMLNVQTISQKEKCILILEISENKLVQCSSWTNYPVPALSDDLAVWVIAKTAQ